MNFPPFFESAMQNNDESSEIVEEVEPESEPLKVEQEPDSHQIEPEVDSESEIEIPESSDDITKFFTFDGASPSLIFGGMVVAAGLVVARMMKA